MKLFFKAKDGGPESKVTGYWLIESKRCFSIALLRFDKGSREAFHTHAFNAVSWVLKGWLMEKTLGVVVDNWYTGKVIGDVFTHYRPSLLPIYTPRERFHQVTGCADVTWALTFRGPWKDTWKEFLPAEDKEITLTNGRKIV